METKDLERVAKCMDEGKALVQEALEKGLYARAELSTGELTKNEWRLYMVLYTKDENNKLDVDLFGRGSVRIEFCEEYLKAYREVLDHQE